MVEKRLFVLVGDHQRRAQERRRGAHDASARAPEHLERGTDVDTVVLMTALTVVQAQERSRKLCAAE